MTEEEQDCQGCLQQLRNDFAYLSLRGKAEAISGITELRLPRPEKESGSQ